MALDLNVLEQNLVEAGLIENGGLELYIAKAAKERLELVDLLFSEDLIDQAKLKQVVAKSYGLEYADLKDIRVPEETLNLIPYSLAAGKNVIAFAETEDQLKVATSEPENDELLYSIEKKANKPIKVYYISKKDLKIALKFYTGDVDEKFTDLLRGVMKDPTKLESLQDASQILDTIILFAFQNNASDIHLEPHKEHFMIRYRVDGLLRTIAELPIKIMDLLTSRVKVLANMRTDEHRAAQDGRFKIELEGNEITMRVSIVPTYDGEKTVLRILSSTSQGLNLEAMGYSKKNLETIKRNMLKTHGMLLITGPTVSGKTTTPRN